MINTSPTKTILFLIFWMSINTTSFGEIIRYIRYEHANNISYGLIKDNKVHQLSAAPYMNG